MRVAQCTYSVVHTESYFCSIAIFLKSFINSCQAKKLLGKSSDFFLKSRQFPLTSYFQGYRFILRMGSQGLSMFSNLALQLILRGPSFLDQLRSGFEANNRNANAVAPPPQQQQQQQLFVREDGELDNREGRQEGIIPKREVEIVEDEVNREMGHGDVGQSGCGEREGGRLNADEDVLPDIPSSDFVFSAPQNPSAPSTSTAAKKERPVSKTRKRSGKSPSRATSSSRSGTSRSSEDYDARHSQTSNIPSCSDVSDVDDYNSESKKRLTTRDANANTVVKSRGRRAVGGDDEGRESRDGSKTKIPRVKATKSSKLTSRHDIDFENDDDLLLISSDDEAVKTTSKGAKSGVARQRKVAKKNTTMTSSSAVDL